MTQTHSELRASCDVLVLKALEKLGKLVSRTYRSEHTRLRSAPWHLAHVATPISPRDLDKGLWGAWEIAEFVFTQHIDKTTARELAAWLDLYTRALVQQQMPHNPQTFGRLFESEWGDRLR